MAHLKESILRTDGALGILINKELLKNSNRRRASRFSGTFKADSLNVKMLCSLSTSAFCTSERLWLGRNLLSR